MSTNAPSTGSKSTAAATLASLKTMPAGVYVVGKAVGKSELRSGVNGKGKAYQNVTTQVLAGERFCRLTQYLNPGEQPLLYEHNEDVVFEVVPELKAQGQFVSSAKPIVI